VGRGRCLFEVLIEKRYRILIGEWGTPKEHLVEEYSERVDIRAPV